MGKRIKLIYILSLFSALMAISVQAYWLYNQYRYEVERYADEIAADVLRVGDEEFAERRKMAIGDDTSYIIDRSSRTQSGTSTIRNVQTQLCFDFKTDVLVDSIIGGQLNMTKLNLSFDATLPEDSIIHGVERNVVNYYIPFQVERLDSLLRARLSQYDFQIAFLPEGDTLSRFNSWKILPEHLFPPCLGVKYRYAPLERKGVMIEVGFPINPLLKRMVGQLILSLFLILLLLSCLGLQINTILKQYKLGELRESFVHTMIHELRRPVQTLKMCVSFLNDKEMRTDEAACDGIVQDALFELDNLSAYLEKLKNMVSADGSATLLHPILFNLQELVEKVIRLVHIPSGKQVAFSTAFPPDLPLVTADPVHIANILSNLISADEQTKVFEKFYRSVHLPDKQIPGLGLGLSYVRQIAEAHHGQVSLRSEVGKGTEVTVGLPIKNDMATPLKILFADDDLKYSLLLKRFLEKEGYDVAYTGNGMMALEQFSVVKPDLVLLDINMPGLNGFEVAEKIRENDRHVLIFFLSDRSDKNDRLKGFSLKGNDYLAKPFYPEELLARIKERFEVNPDVKVEEEIYHFANTVFDYSTNEIRTGNSKTLVTSRQAEILRILARNPNVAIDREIILSAVWGNVSYANSLALNVQVTYLRKALRNDPLTSIVSLTKKGYMLKG